MLATCATAAARRYRVRVKQDYFEPTNLWIAVALEPGNRKSAVQSAATSPLIVWEREQAEAIAEEIQKATSAVKTLEAKVTRLRADAAKEKDDSKSKKLAQQITEIEANTPPIPIPPQLFTSDVTPERLGTIIGHNGERMAWLSSEGGFFDALAGRYSGGIPNLDLILKTHSGDPEKVDRGSRPPVHLYHPFLTIGLSPQPDVLRGLSAKPGFRGRGLLGRFIYLLPTSPLGYRKGDSRPVSEDIEKAFAEGVIKILNTPSAVTEDGNPTSHILMISPDANTTWREFSAAVEERMRPGGEFENTKDWAGKAPGTAIRLAGVLHAITHAEPWASPIALETMENALEMMVVFAKHSVAALELTGADESITAAKQVWHWFESNRHPSASLRDVHQALKGRFPHVAGIKAAVDVLAERGYVEVDTAKSNGPGRQPSPTIRVRPDIVAGWN